MTQSSCACTSSCLRASRTGIMQEAHPDLNAAVELDGLLESRQKIRQIFRCALNNSGQLIVHRDPLFELYLCDIGQHLVFLVVYICL